MILAQTATECSWGYRLIRSERGDKPVVVNGPGSGELGFELFNWATKSRTLAKRFKSEGKHVVQLGYIGRHPMYEEADEFWGYKSLSYPWTMQPEMKTLLYETFPGFRFGTTKCHQLQPSFAPLEPSAGALAWAKNYCKDTPSLVIVCPRWKKEDRSFVRNFRYWPDVFDGIKDAKVVACVTKDQSVSLPCDYIEDLVGINDMVDCEAALFRLADCTILGDSGVMALAACSGAMMVQYCQVSTELDAFYNSLKTAFPNLGTDRIIAETDVDKMVEAARSCFGKRADCRMSV